VRRGRRFDRCCGTDAHLRKRPHIQMFRCLHRRQSSLKGCVYEEVGSGKITVGCLFAVVGPAYQANLGCMPGTPWIIPHLHVAELGVPRYSLQNTGIPYK
jgi:hypothetical protein